MPEILTRKFGGVPGWAVLGGVVVVAGLVWLSRRQKAGAAGKADQSGNLALGSSGGMVNNPAMTVPYVPSVTVTGIPPQPPSQPDPITTPPPQGSTVTAGSGNPSLQGPPFNGKFIPLFKDDLSPGYLGMVPWGMRLTVDTKRKTQTGGPGGQFSYVPVTWLNGRVSTTDISPSGSGSGGFLTNIPIAGMFGWTSGWTPVGAGIGVQGAGGGAPRTTARAKGRSLTKKISSQRKYSSGYGGGYPGSYVGGKPRSVRSRSAILTQGAIFP
jgi:hypothetical protein